jgi:hypothetical protein
MILIQILKNYIILYKQINIYLKLKKNKLIFLKLPEYLLIVAVIFYWISTSSLFNPIAIGLLLVLIFQIVFQNKILGLIIPSVLILSCLYMILALISELYEFPTFNSDAKSMLIIGLTYFTFTVIVSFFMIFKFAFLNLEKKIKIF